MEICEECKYWRPSANMSGECHRNAPLPRTYTLEEKTLDIVVR